jgi:hypothetical protein
MFQNQLPSIFFTPSVGSEVVLHTPPAPPIKALDHTFESQLPLKKDKEKERKGRNAAEEEDGSYFEDWMTAPQLLAMSIYRDLQEVLRCFLKREHQFLFELQLQIRTEKNLHPYDVYSPLYVRHSNIDKLRSNKYLNMQDAHQRQVSKKNTVIN